MKPEKIIYMQTFPTGSFQNVKLGMEVSLDDTDDPQDAFYLAKKEVSHAFDKLNQQIEYYAPPPEVYDSPMKTPINDEPIPYNKLPVEQRIASLINDINSCQDLTMLTTYRFMLKDQKIKEAYDKKYSELQKQ